MLPSEVIDATYKCEQVLFIGYRSKYKDRILLIELSKFNALIRI